MAEAEKVDAVRSAAAALPTPTLPRLRLVPPYVEAPVARVDGTPESDGQRHPHCRGQQALELGFLLPCGLPTIPKAPNVQYPGPRRWDIGEEPEEDVPTSRELLPPAGPWAARLAQAILEVCSAGRPVAQLLRWTKAGVYEDLQRRYIPRAKRDVSRRRVAATETVRSVHVCEPADGVAEVSVMIDGGERPRALAIRIEGWRGRWICTELDWI